MHPDIKMHALTVLPGEEHLAVPEDTLIADALVDAGVNLPMPCGGKGIRGKCKVKIEGHLSQKTDIETKSTVDQPGYRLACQTRLAGNASVHIQGKPPVMIKNS